MNESRPSADPSALDRSELVRLARDLDTRARTFPFDHARLAWLESHPHAEA